MPRHKCDVAKRLIAVSLSDADIPLTYIRVIFERFGRRRCLQNEESEAVVVLPPLQDVLEEEQVAQVRTDSTPADEFVALGVVDVEVLLDATLEVARVSAQQPRPAQQRRPALVPHATRVELLLHERAPQCRTVSVDVKGPLEGHTRRCCRRRYHLARRRILRRRRRRILSIRRLRIHRLRRHSRLSRLSRRRAHSLGMRILRLAVRSRTAVPVAIAVPVPVPVAVAVAPLLAARLLAATPPPQPLALRPCPSPLVHALRRASLTVPSAPPFSGNYRMYLNPRALLPPFSPIYLLKLDSSGICCLCRRSSRRLSLLVRSTVASRSASSATCSIHPVIFSYKMQRRRIGTSLRG
eukprot:6211734-Pleurochrysis_carterae.AAC.3